MLEEKDLMLSLCEGGGSVGEDAIVGEASLYRRLCNSEVTKEVLSQGKLACPIMLTGLLLFSKSLISTFFLSRLGDAALAGGSLAISFANITGHSVIKGLSMAMEPLCGQAYGAKRWVLMSNTFQKALLLLLVATIPITLLWLKMDTILVWLGQDKEIVVSAKAYLLYSLPDLLAQAHLHPLRIFMAMQNLVKPLTVSSFVAILLHVPVNYILVDYLDMRVQGVALAAAWNTVGLNLALVTYLMFSDKAIKPWAGASLKAFRGWKTLVKLAIPNAISVCLEWWWYELLLIMCGLLHDPTSCIAAMGILIQTTGLMYVIPSSLGMSLSARVGHELGAARPRQASRAVQVGIFISAVCGALAFGFTILVRHSWGRMFTTESHILALTSVVLPIVGICELGNCPQTVACGVLRASARPELGANINFTAFYLLGLPVAAIAGFSLQYGFAGLWFGLIAAQASCAAMMLYAIAHTDWEQQADRARALTMAASGLGDTNNLTEEDTVPDSALLLNCGEKGNEHRNNRNKSIRQQFQEAFCQKMEF